MTKQTIDTLIRDTIKDYMMDFGFSVNRSEIDEIFQNGLDDVETKKIYDKYVNAAKNTDENKRKLRDEAQKIMKKYTSEYIKHNNVSEIEADRYAVNRSSKKDFKNALKEYSRKIIKSDKYMTAKNKNDIQEDLRRRVKAINDKELSTNSKFKDIY